MPSPFGAIAGIAAGGLQALYGIYQSIHGNHKLNQLEANAPQYQVDPNVLYNQSLARQTASEGIPDEAKNLYSENIQRGLGSTIGAEEATGQDLNSINQSYNTSNDAFRQLMMADAQQKQKNQDLLMQANKDVAAENLRAFDVNKYTPFQLKYNQYSNQTNSGAQNTFGGINDIGATANSYYNYLSEINNNKTIPASGGGNDAGGSGM